MQSQVAEKRNAYIDYELEESTLLNTPSSFHGSHYQATEEFETE